MLEDLVYLLLAVLLLGGTQGARVFLRRQKAKRRPSSGKKCKGCKHFDADEWAEAKRAHPAFEEASRWVRPNDMGRPKGDDESERGGLLNLKQNHWDCFAVCVQPDSPNYAKALHEDDSCEHWERRDVQ